MKNFYFWSHFHTRVYLKFFTKEVNQFCSWARPNINIFDHLVIEVWKYIQYRRVGSVFYAVLQLQYSYEYINWNSFKNRSKWASAEMHLRRFSTAFRTAPLLRTHVGACFQSVHEESVGPYCGKLTGKPMHFPYGELYHKMGIRWEKCTHIIVKIWESISQTFPMQWVLLHFPILWEIYGKTHAFLICCSIP